MVTYPFVRRTFSAGLHRGDLRICCGGYIGDQYFSTLASVDGGDAPGIERGRNVRHHGLSGDFCRRTIGRRSAVGSVRPAAVILIGLSLFVAGAIGCAFARDLSDLLI